MSCVTHAQSQNKNCFAVFSRHKYARACVRIISKSAGLLNLVIRMMVQSRRDGDGWLNGSGTVVRYRVLSLEEQTIKKGSLPQLSF